MALYRWRQSTIKTVYDTETKGTGNSDHFIIGDYSGTSGYVYYSQTFTDNGNGTVTLDSPQSKQLVYGGHEDFDAEYYISASETTNELFQAASSYDVTRVSFSRDHTIHVFAMDSSGHERKNTNRYYNFRKGPGTFLSYVYSKNLSAYPNGGAQSNYYYDQMMEVSPPASITVPQMVMQGKQISISWAESDGASNYILERKSSTDSSWVQVYSGANLTFSETVGTWTSVQYRVKAGGDNLYGNYTTSSVVEVIESVSIAISGTNGYLGTLTSDVSYTVSSSGTSELTVVETINGTSRTYTATNGATNKIPVVDLATGYGTITVQASTNPGSGVVSVTREWTYTKTAPTFAEQGGLAQLTQQGKTIWAKTIAEAIRTPGIWGGNLGLALGKLAQSVLYNPNTLAKYTETKVNLATATVGQEVNLPYNGVMVPHIVVHIGNPIAALYDASCDGVWLLRKDVVGPGAWNSSGVNTLAESTIMSTMAGYVSNYSNDVQTAIKTVKIPYCIGNGSSTVNSGANGLECKVFPLSGREVGLNSSAQDAVDGAKLEYFLSGDYANSQQKRIAKLDGIDSDYWLRSPNMNGSATANYILSSGSRGGIGVTSSKGLRPAFIMPTTFTATYYVDQDGTVHDSQEYEEAGTFTDISGGAIPMVRIETGSYVGTGTYGSGNRTSLSFSFQPKIVFVFCETYFNSQNTYYYYPATFIFGVDYAATSGDGVGGSNQVVVSWSGNNVSWYSTDTSSMRASARQLNYTGYVYRYVAIS